MINKKIIYSLLFVLCVLGFARTLSFPFVHDDTIIIKNNPSITDLSDIPGIFLQTFRLKNISLANPYYRPVLEILYRLQYRLFLFNPFGYHLTNILFHFFNSLLIFHLMFLLTQRTNFSGFIAALFAIHPVQTEAVACISGISNLLYSFLVLTSLLLYTKAFGKNTSKPNWLILLCALVCYMIAVFGKEQAVVMPLILVIYDLCFVNPAKNLSVGRLISKGFFFFAALNYLLWRQILLGAATVHLSAIQQNFLLRFLTIPRILLSYLRLIFSPIDLHYYRNIDLLHPVFAFSSVFVLLSVILLFLIRFLPKERARLFLFGLGWFFVFILPVLNIIPINIEYSFIALFEHFLYLPIVGILLCGGVLAEYFIEKIIPSRLRYPVKITAMTFIITSCLLLTIIQNNCWSGEIALFERTVKYEKDFGRAHVLLGRAYMREGMGPQAAAAFEKALVIFEKYRGLVQSSPANGLYDDLILNVKMDLEKAKSASLN